MTTRLSRIATFGFALALAFSLIANVAVAKPNKSPTIVDVAVTANASGGAYEGMFDTLISAVVNLDLADVLSGNQPYTVFAPVDDAFAALSLYPESFVGLDADAKAAYTDIVLYHVTRGVRQSQSVVSAKQMNMLNGDKAMVDGTVIDGYANIVVPDVMARNGVIHAIDMVLLPPTE